MDNKLLFYTFIGLIQGLEPKYIIRLARLGDIEIEVTQNDIVSIAYLRFGQRSVVVRVYVDNESYTFEEMKPIAEYAVMKAMKDNLQNVDLSNVFVDLKPKRKSSYGY